MFIQTTNKVPGIGVRQHRLNFMLFLSLAMCPRENALPTLPTLNPILPAQTRETTPPTSN
jgi:hypothetical protein